MHAGFTMSFQNDLYTDRGTGYNKNGGGGWWDWDDSPTERVETVRVGWPNFMRLANGKELILTHDGDGALRLNSRTFGSGSWSEVEIPNPTGKTLLWPHATVGGADGNSIHFVCITEPIAIGADSTAVYNGQDGSLLYYRSQDGGTTWDMQAVQLDGTDSTLFLGFSADTYTVYSREDKVVIGVFGDFNDTFILTSADNGDTWEKTIIVNTPVDLYVIDTGIDLDGDLVADTVYNSDGTGCVYIDTDNTTHVFFPEMAYLDDDLTDASWSYFPGWNGIAYWREDYGPEVYGIVTGMQDLDGDDLLTLAADGANIPNNGIALATYPSMAEDDDGNLYMTFSSMVETHDNGDANFRHIHVINSEDGGDTWLDIPVDLTPDLDFDGFECTFPALSHQVVDDKIHLTYQRDTEPGLHVAGDLDPADDNDIVYFCITTDLVVEPTVYEQFMDGGLVVYPNPAIDQVNIAVKNMSGALVEILNATGQVIHSETMQFDNVQVDVSKLAAGVYTVNAILGNSKVSNTLMVK